MSKVGLRKKLQSMDKSEVVSLVLEIYSLKKEIKEYLDYIVNPNEKEQFKKVKQIVENEYFPMDDCPKGRLAVAKKAISDFSKLKPSPKHEATLLIFLVECGCRFADMYGYIEDEYFYTGLEKNFERALKFMEKHGLLEKFRPNAERCIKWASSCDGDFADNMKNIFCCYFR